MFRIIVIAFCAALMFCSNPTSSPDKVGEQNKIIVVVDFQADADAADPEMCFVYSDGIQVKTFLKNGIDSLIVSDGATLHAEYYKKYMPNGAIKDTVACSGLVWRLN